MKKSLVRLVAATIALTTFGSTAGQSMAAQKAIRVGNSYEFQVAGNPSTGYRWSFNSSKSSGLDVVKIDDLGYGNPASRKLGAPAPYRFRLTCLKAGSAELVFDYVAPDRHTIGKSHVHWVRCK